MQQLHKQNRGLMQNIGVTTEKSPMAANNKKVSLYIHDDVAFSILSKLPLKSLNRFTCVCQSWSRLFQNPNFIIMFGKNFISAHCSLYNDTSVLLRLWTYELYLLSGDRKINLEMPLPFREDFGYLNIFGSSVNGLLCVRNAFKRMFALWNPATQEFKIIPLSAVGTRQDENIISMSFIQGFGYDSVGDDYKVISIVRLCELDGVSWPNYLWEIYSLKSNSWRELDVIMPKSTPLKGSNVYLNGACHWCGKTNLEESVVSFNLSNEVFLTTPFPSYMHQSVDYKHLVVLNDSIAVISHSDKTTHFHISILGELGVKESWVKFFTIGPLSCIDRPIGVGKKGDVFFRNIDGKLVCFDLTTGMIEEIDVKGKPFHPEVIIYKENLLSMGNK